MPPEAQGSAPVEQGSAPAAAAQADTTPQATAPDERVNELLGRLTAIGRERKAEREQLMAELQRQNQTTSALQQQLNYIQANVSQQQYQQWEAQLATLSPADQALERARMAERTAQAAVQRVNQAAAAPRQSYAPQAAQETDEEYSQRLAQEMVDKANRRYKLAGEHAVQVADITSRDDWADPTTFGLAAGEIAAQRAAKRETAVSDTDAKIRERITQDVLKELGVSGALSATPSGERTEPGSDEIKKIADASRTNRRGPSTSIAALREQREALASRVSRE